MPRVRLANGVAENSRENGYGHIVHGEVRCAGVQPRLVQPVGRQAHGDAAGAEQDRDLELSLSGRREGPGQVDGQDEDDQVAEDGNHGVAQEKDALVQARLVLDRVVPKGLDGRANDHLADLDRQEHEHEQDDEDVDPLGHERLARKGPGRHQEERRLGGDGRGAVRRTGSIRALYFGSGRPWSLVCQCVVWDVASRISP